jgi:septal ring-binding cell division protein DamX
VYRFKSQVLYLELKKKIKCNRVKQINLKKSAIITISSKRSSDTNILVQNDRIIHRVGIHTFNNMQKDMNKQSSNLFSVVTISIVRAIALLSLACFIGIKPAIAQDALLTANDVSPTTESLEQQYLNELDRWMLQAYEGDRDAQFIVGVLFSNNQFNSADYEQSVYWYKQAARQGHALSQYNLGHQYLTGLGVKRSESDAMNWWLKAAEQDHPLAQFNVGRGYYLAIGLNEDHSQSEYWFKRAANNNEPKSIEILEQLGWAQAGEFSEPQVSAPSSNTAASQTDNAVKEPEPKASSAVIAPRTDDSVDEANPSAEIAAKASDIINNQPQVDAQIAVYTDPSKRAVLISILDSHKGLTALDKAGKWTRVRNKTGLPVWVHQNFISVQNSQGIINGERVNARSVPLIAKGTIVGRLKNGQSVAILDRQKSWYRVNSPASFEAWVKTEDLIALIKSQVTNTKQKVLSNANDSSLDVSRKSANIKFETQNDWLFSQPTSNYTLQLASFDDPQTVAAFESRKKFVNNPDLHRFTAASKNMQWTYFLYGSYADKESAIDGRDKIDQKRAWVRSFDKLQQNRCLAWKKQIPTPKLLNKYCS